MKQENAKLDYDFENDILFCSKNNDQKFSKIFDFFYMSAKNRKYSSSIDYDNFILDLDENNKIVGLEILSASNLFNLSKLQLQSLKQAKFEFIIDSKKIKINIHLEILFRNKQENSNLILNELNDYFKNSFDSSIIGYA